MRRKDAVRRMVRQREAEGCCKKDGEGDHQRRVDVVELGCATDEREQTLEAAAGQLHAPPKTVR